MFLLDVAPDFPGGGIIGLAAGAVFFLIFAGVAALAFFMIRRTVKMAIRMFIVAAILLIAFVGSLALWFGIGSSPSKPARPNRPSANSTR